MVGPEFMIELIRFLRRQPRNFENMTLVHVSYLRGPKLGTYSDWGLSSVLVINKHLSHHVSHRRVNFRVFLANFFDAELPQKKEVF